MLAKNKAIKKKGKYQNLFFSVLIVSLTAGIVFLIIFSSIKMNRKRAELTNRIDSLKQEIKSLEEDQKRLQSGISQTESESYWEEKVREQGYKKPGEETIVVLPPEENQAPPEKQKSFWEKIMGPVRNFFGGL